MAFNFKSLFVSDNYNKKEGFHEYAKYSNKELKELAKKNLTRFERAKFDKAMAGKIESGHKMSAHQIIKEVGQEHDFRFKSTIKKKMFTTKPQSGLTPEQIQRNLLSAKYDRLQSEAPVQDTRHHKVEEYHSATAPDEAPRTSFFQPGSTEPDTSDHPTNQPFARPPV